MSLANERFQIIRRLTPIASDVLFYEVRDSVIPKNKQPQYGQAHENSILWPNHKLCFIEPAPRDAGKEYWYYVADRESQDLYNFEFGFTQVGGLSIPSVKRTYITPRETFGESSVEIGSAMPNVPEGKFSEDYILHDIQQVRSERELDSLFVIEQRIYILPTASEGKVYGGIVTEDTTREVVVDDGEPVETGIHIIASEVTPIGNGHSVKFTREVEGGVWPNPVEHDKGKSRENLIPPKFRDFVIRETVTRKVGSIPESVTLEDDVVAKEYKRETPDRVEEKVTTELIDENADGLIGQEYGKIVTLDTFESLVPEETQADTGIEIVESIVSPIGNGKSIKVTKSVGGGSWPDPVENVKSVGTEGLIPAKYRRMVTMELSSIKLSSMPSSISISGDQISKVVKKETPDRWDETTTTLTLNEGADPLEGRVMFLNFGGGLADTVEEVVNDGEEAEQGFLVLSSSVSPLGNGKSIKETTTADEFRELTGIKRDDSLGVDFTYTTRVIDANSEPPENSDVEPIDKWRSRVKTIDLSAAQTALGDVHIVYPTEHNIQLPNVLRAATVLVSRTISNGNSFQLGQTGASGNRSSVSLAADLSWRIEEGYSGPVPAEIHVFFLPLGDANTTAIAAKVGASPWPMYRPVSHRVVIAGHGAQKDFSTSASSGGVSGSEDSSVTSFSNVAAIPACINEEIPITVVYTDVNLPTTLIDEYYDQRVGEWEAYLDQVQAELDAGFYRGYPVTPEQKAFIESMIARQRNVLQFAGDLNPEDFTVTVSPDTIEATSPDGIQAGKYIVRANVELYGYEMVRVTAIVVDTTNLAI